MNPCPNPARPSSLRAFTLVELLVVVAIIAVVGGSVAVTYGRKTVDDSKDQLTLHEMHEIKKAFLRFHSDNYLRLQREFTDHGGADLPTGGFRGTFHSNHGNDDLFDGRMEFFERYGLWFLMQPTIPHDGIAHDDETNPNPVNRYRFPAFRKYDTLAGEGWNGPYLDATSRSAWTLDGIDFPQVADKHRGTYRLLYYEHCENVADLTKPIYRRLLLVAPRGNAAWDEIAAGELLDLSGNLRGGGNDGSPLNLGTGAFENRVASGDEGTSSPLFVLELLNMDQQRQ